MNLSPDQQVVFDAMVEWSNTRSTPLLTTGGLAGSGKTTLLGAFAAQAHLQVAYVTFTGRAASVLSRKLKAAGVKLTDKLRPPEEFRRRRDPSAKLRALYDFDLRGTSDDPPYIGTLHRLLYSPVVDSKTEELLGWRKRAELDRPYDIIVIDEASMVSDEMLHDLQVHNIPILAVGDHGQLPPVMSSGGLMAEPMLRLEKIHRQAADNPIIRFAHNLREKGTFERIEGDDRIRFLRRTDTEIIEQVFRGAENPLDIGVLCWTNRTRIRLNAYARRGLGRKGVPAAGEVVMCLKNFAPVYNGMRGILTTDGVLDGWRVTADVAFPEEELPAQRIAMCAPQFNRERAFKSIEELRERGVPAPSFSEAGKLFDYGYGLTVHKSQGSQFKHAIFYVDRQVEPESSDWRRFAYTAATRASEILTIMA